MNVEIKVTQRKVYQGFRRGYLTKRGAIDSIVRELIKQHCSCEHTPNSQGRFYSFCKWHGTNSERRRNRIKRWVIKRQNKNQDKIFKTTRRKIGYGFRDKILDTL